jgi:hypothetical protein
MGLHPSPQLWLLELIKKGSAELVCFLAYYKEENNIYQPITKNSNNS